MAAKILANLIVMGSGILIRAFAQAYRQALASSWTSVAVLAGVSGPFTGLIILK